MTRPDLRLLSCREVDRIYRLRNGTAAAAFKAGQLPGRKRGRAFFVSAKIADQLFGLALVAGRSVAALLVCLAASLPALDFTESDKQGHAISGAIIGYVASGMGERMGERMGLSRTGRVALGITASLAAGWAKEIHDRQGHGTYDPTDAHATAIGGALGTGPPHGLAIVITPNLAVITAAWTF